MARRPGNRPGGAGVSGGEQEIRLATAADCASVEACVRAAYSKYVSRMGREPAPMLADYRALIARGVVHVLSEPTSGDACGLIVLWPEDGALFVENVAVSPHHQGQGIGRRLMAFAEDRAQATDLPQVRLYTNEAMTENLEFYRRLGFEETGRHLDEGYRRVFLRKMVGQ